MKLYSESKEIKELVESGRWEQAKETLEGLVSQRNDSAMLNDLALIYARLGEREKAFEIIERAKAQDDDVRIWVNHYFLDHLRKIKNERGENALKRIKELKIGDPNLKPRLSIIMRTYNRGQLIEHSVKSVLGQKFQDWELVIANDGGIRDVEQTLEKLWDRRMVYAYAEHSGPAGVFNVGLRLARGEYIGFLDDDDIVYPEHWQRMVSYLDSHPEVKVLYSGIKYVWLKSDERVEKELIRLPPGFQPLEIEKRGFPMQFTALVFRKECLEKAIGFLEDIRSSVDWEFAWRLNQDFEFSYLSGVAGENYARKKFEQMTKYSLEHRFMFNLIRYYYGLSPFFSWEMRYKDLSQKFLDKLKKVFLECPELVSGLDFRLLYRHQGYVLFYNLAKELEEEDQGEKAIRAYWVSLSLAPYEPKIWLKIIRFYLRKLWRKLAK